MKESLRPEITEVQIHPKAGNPRTVIMNKYAVCPQPYPPISRNTVKIGVQL